MIIIRFLLVSIIILVVMAVFFITLTVLLRFGNDRKRNRLNRLDDLWNPLLLEVLSETKPVAALWDVVAPKEELFFVRLLMKYFRRLGGSERDVLRDAARPYLSTVAAQLTQRQMGNKALAVQTLAALGMPEYELQVLASLDDESPLVAMVAAQSLARCNNPDYVRAILSRLSRFTYWSRQYLAGMLRTMGTAAAPELRKTFADADQPIYNRTVVADALRELNDVEAASIAAGILDVESNRDLVAASLRLIARTGNPEHEEKVIELVESDDPVIRATALQALGFIGGEACIPYVRNAISDESPWVALRAARALKDLAGVQALEQMHPKGRSRKSLVRQVLEESDVSS